MEVVKVGLGLALGFVFPTLLVRLTDDLPQRIGRPLPDWLGAALVFLLLLAALPATTLLPDGVATGFRYGVITALAYWIFEMIRSRPKRTT